MNIFTCKNAVPLHGFCVMVYVFEIVSARIIVDSFEHNNSFIQIDLNNMFLPIGPGPKHVEVILNK
jgi:hypothetical protein